MANNQVLSFEDVCLEKQIVEDHTMFSEIYISKSENG